MNRPAKSDKILVWHSTPLTTDWSTPMRSHVLPQAASFGVSLSFLSFPRMPFLRGLGWAFAFICTSFSDFWATDTKANSCCWGSRSLKALSAVNLTAALVNTRASSLDSTSTFHTVSSSAFRSYVSFYYFFKWKVIITFLRECQTWQKNVFVEEGLHRKKFRLFRLNSFTQPQKSRKHNAPIKLFG